MKKVQMELYEKGDHIMVTHGYNKGKVGTVVRHPSATANVIYELAGSTYDDADEDDYDDYDDDYYGDYEDSPAKFLKYITKAEYEATLKKLKILTVPGLPVGVRFQGTNLIIGDNVITTVNAKKIAEFINEHTKTKGKKK
jgi:hypothetical protein